MSPAIVGGFVTIEPPGEDHYTFIDLFTAIFNPLTSSHTWDDSITKDFNIFMS